MTCWRTAGTDDGHARAIHKRMPLPVIGGFTQDEGVALGAFVTSGKGRKCLPNLDEQVHGLLLENGAYMECYSFSATDFTCVVRVNVRNNVHVQFGSGTSH
jgi:hypothetical protein